MLDVSFGVQSQANTKVQSTRRELKGYPHTPAVFPRIETKMNRFASRFPIW